MRTVKLIFASGSFSSLTEQLQAAGTVEEANVLIGDDFACHVYTSPLPSQKSLLLSSAADGHASPQGEPLPPQKSLLLNSAADRHASPQGELLSASPTLQQLSAVVRYVLV